MSTPIPLTRWLEFEGIPNREVFRVLEYLYGRAAVDDIAAKVFQQHRNGSVIPSDMNFVWPRF